MQLQGISRMSGLGGDWFAGSPCADPSLSTSLACTIRGWFGGDTYTAPPPPTYELAPKVPVRNADGTLYIPATTGDDIAAAVIAANAGSPPADPPPMNWNWVLYAAAAIGGLLLLDSIGKGKH